MNDVLTDVVAWRRARGDAEEPYHTYLEEELRSKDHDYAILTAMKRAGRSLHPNQRALLAVFEGGKDRAFFDRLLLGAQAHSLPHHDQDLFEWLRHGKCLEEAELRVCQKHSKLDDYGLRIFALLEQGIPFAEAKEQVLTAISPFKN